MTTVQPTVLTYTNDKGQPLAQLVHKSVRLRHETSSQECEAAPTWVVEFSRPYGWENNGGGLPRELGPGRPDSIAAVTVADATEALARIGNALEVWISDREIADAALVRRVGKAALYGLDPELPLGEDDQAERDAQEAAYQREHPEERA